MNILTIVFIALGLAMDAFAVSVSEGLAQAKIRVRFALSVALCFGIFQAGMTLGGYFAGSLFADFVASFSHWLAFGLLTFVGGRMAYSSLANWKREKARMGIAGSADPNDGHHHARRAPLNFFGLILLGFATSIDALAVGVNFALGENINILTAAALIGLITFWISLAGVYFGKLLGKYLTKYAELAGGVILIAIGIHILIGGLLGV